MKFFLKITLSIILMISNNVYGIYHIHTDIVEEGIKIKKDITKDFDEYVDKLENLMYQSDGSGYEKQGHLKLYQDIYKKGKIVLKKYELYKDKFVDKLIKKHKISKKKIHVKKDEDIDFIVAACDNDYSKFTQSYP